MPGVFPESTEAWRLRTHGGAAVSSNNDARDKFAAEYSAQHHLEALSPDPVLGPYERDHRWLTQVYESVKPPSGSGRLLWHALGAKTVQLINENVHVESVRDDVETLVMDAEVLEEILRDPDHEKRAREVEIRVIARLRRHLGNPKFMALGERLEKVKDRHEQGFLNSLEFLKAVLEIAREWSRQNERLIPGPSATKRKRRLLSCSTRRRAVIRT